MSNWIRDAASLCYSQPGFKENMIGFIRTAHDQGCEAQRTLSICQSEAAQAVRRITVERDEAQRQYRELSECVLGAHHRALPENWVYTDAQTTIDFLVAECKTAQKERDEAKWELDLLKCDEPKMKSTEGLLSKLREPVDEGGFDGLHQDDLHVSAASRIEELWKWFVTERTMHGSWEKRAYQAESERDEAQTKAGFWMNMDHATKQDLELAESEIKRLRSAIGIKIAELELDATQLDSKSSRIDALEWAEWLEALIHPRGKNER